MQYCNIIVFVLTKMLTAQCSFQWGVQDTAGEGAAPRVGLLRYGAYRRRLDSKYSNRVGHATIC